ncbi:hypothetical protein B0H14DRAFT_1631742 [Mycena olivaceomarginata]|nr:hypothetical protein B0H14DRAFT_1631742 [Mycena olivaceomarginata]
MWHIHSRTHHERILLLWERILSPDSGRINDFTSALKVLKDALDTRLAIQTAFVSTNTFEGVETLVTTDKKWHCSITDSDSEDDVEFRKLEPQANATYLEQFFSSYPKYEYDPSGPASQQFQQLRMVYKNERGDLDALYQGYNRALGLAFSQHYGDDVDDLENWQRLCRTVEIFPVPDSVAECKFAIEDSHVNLIDLMDIHTTGQPVHRFRTEKELAEYTKKTGKYFPASEACKGDLLRFLLRFIFRPPPEHLMRRGGVFVERDS